jgi:hypothetical protein
MSRKSAQRFCDNDMRKNKDLKHVAQKCAAVLQSEDRVKKRSERDGGSRALDLGRRVAKLAAIFVRGADGSTDMLEGVEVAQQ